MAEFISNSAILSQIRNGAVLAEADQDGSCQDEQGGGPDSDTEYDVQVRAVELDIEGPWSATPAEPGQSRDNARAITLASTSSGELDPMGGNHFWGRIDAQAVSDGLIHSSNWDYFKQDAITYSENGTTALHTCRATNP